VIFFLLFYLETFATNLGNYIIEIFPYISDEFLCLEIVELFFYQDVNALLVKTESTHFCFMVACLASCTPLVIIMWLRLSNNL
jgi:hypothetical protein